MKNFNNKNLIVITGPTGIGKTDLSIEVATLFDSPIISADSRQFYRELVIGTAAPSNTQLEQVEHYFIGNLSITDYYNASMFEVEVNQLLEKLYKKQRVVVMAGGSGMYVDAVCNGIDDLPSVDAELRAGLAEQYENNGIAWLRKKLKIVDPDHYEVVDLRNPNRMLKAIEISLQTGKPYSSFLTSKRKSRDFSIIKVGLTLERELLYSRIDERVDKMIESGLIAEAEQLYPCRNLNSLNTVGYKELFQYFDNNISLTEAIRLIKRNSRRYAKRQLTWLARDKDVMWFKPTQIDEITEYIKNRIA